MLNSELENGGDLPLQLLGARFGKTVGAGSRMDTGRKERFVRIDIAYAGDKRLIEQERLDVSGVALETRQKFGRGGC